MTFGEILDAVRDQYLARFRQVVAEHRRTHRVAVEAALLTADGRLARRPGGLPTPERQDLFLLSPEPARAVEVTCAEALSFPEVRFEWEDVPVAVSPFRWHACVVALDGLTEAVDWKPLRNWFAAWFDETDHHAPLADGLRGAVHAVSEPSFDDGVAQLTVDLGSAPADAVEQLLDALARLSPRAIRIGQPQRG
jgi:hypothetical protein